MAQDIDRYDSLAGALLVSATFAGTITFSIVFQSTDSSITINKNILAAASAVFLGSAISSISVLVAVETVSRILQKNEDHTGPLRLLAIIAFICCGALQIAGYGLLIYSFRPSFNFAFVFGVSFFSFAGFLAVLAAVFHFSWARTSIKSACCCN
jgi:hypothetical protein